MKILSGSRNQDVFTFFFSPFVWLITCFSLLVNLQSWLCPQIMDVSVSAALISATFIFQLPVTLMSGFKHQSCCSAALTCRSRDRSVKAPSRSWPPISQVLISPASSRCVRFAACGLRPSASAVLSQQRLLRMEKCWEVNEPDQNPTNCRVKLAD